MLVLINAVMSMVVWLHKQPLIQIRLIQRSTASLLIVVLTIIGLLNVPTECACGSGIAHSHSLFLIPHHHHEDGQVHAEFAELHVPEIAKLSGNTSPVIRNLTTSFSTEQQFANPSTILSWNLASAVMWDLVFNLPTLLGLATPPEPPPPRPQA